MKLYHYTSIEAFLKIWVSKQLRFSESKNMNDLFEKRKSWQLIHGMIPATIVNSTSEAINEFSKTFSNILAQYKQISLTLDYKNIGGWESPMMWGQYAHNEKGVCIEFDSEKLHFPKNAYRAKIKYSYDVPAIVFAKEDVLIDGTYLEQFIIENRKLFFLPSINIGNTKMSIVSFLIDKSGSQ